jgi:hypothetical protein
LSDPLGTYLHDHLSGAKAAIDLLEEMRDRDKDRPLAEFATQLLAEVQADRDTLQRLAEKVGSGSNVFKEFTGWLGEKATRLKVGEGSAGAFGTFEALELLALGVLGKMGLWRALDVAAADDPRLSGYDFKQLAARADRQHQLVERQRLEFAATALRPIG